MPSRADKIARAEAQIATDLAAGIMINTGCLFAIGRRPVVELSLPALERLCGLARVPRDRARLFEETLLVQVRLEHWVGFEVKLRAAGRAIVGALRLSQGNESERREYGVEVLAISYARFLRRHGRVQQALRVLRRLSRWSSGSARHFAETEAGMIELDRERYQSAIEHFVASVSVVRAASTIRGYSHELLNALESRGVRAPVFIAAKKRLDSPTIVAALWPD